MSGIARLLRSPGVAAIGVAAQSIEPGTVGIDRHNRPKVVTGGGNYVSGAVASPRRPAQERTAAVEDKIAILESDPSAGRVV